MSAFDNSPHVLRPRQQRSREALAKIVQAAEHILRTDGPDGFSIAAVARTSGLPTANIYRRFRFKEDILLALWPFPSPLGIPNSWNLRFLLILITKVSR
jgi:hypothetical protein